MEIVLKIMWAIISVLMIALGIYFTFYFDFIQFRFSNYRKCFHHEKKKKLE